MIRQQPTESQIQRACVRWFRLQYPEIEPLFFSVPNGGYRMATTAKIMKAEGQRAGVADLILLLPRQGYGALCIEMKRGKGRQSDAQKEFQRLCDQHGQKYVVCRSLEDFMREVREYLGGEYAENANKRVLRRFLASGG